MRPHLDCGEVIYDEVSNEFYYHEFESIQYNNWLTVIATMQQISKQILYQEKCLESPLLRVGTGNFFSKVFLKASNRFLQISSTKKCQMLEL